LGEIISSAFAMILFPFVLVDNVVHYFHKLHGEAIHQAV